MRQSKTPKAKWKLKNISTNPCNSSSKLLKAVISIIATLVTESIALRSTSINYWNFSRKVNNLVQGRCFDVNWDANLWIDELRKKTGNLNLCCFSYVLNKPYILLSIIGLKLPLNNLRRHQQINNGGTLMSHSLQHRFRKQFCIIFHLFCSISKDLYRKQWHGRKLVNWSNSNAAGVCECNPNRFYRIIKRIRRTQLIDAQSI